jgi:hypothetical protein
VHGGGSKRQCLLTSAFLLCSSSASSVLVATGLILAVCTWPVYVTIAKWSIQLYKAIDTDVSLSSNTGCIVYRVLACTSVLVTVYDCNCLTRIA